MSTDSVHAKKSRLSHALIDALVAVGDAQSYEQVDNNARSLALAGLNINDLTTFGPDGQPRFDLTPLVFGALDLLMWLARTLADHADLDPLDVLTDLRQQVSDWEQDAGFLDDPPNG